MSLTKRLEKWTRLGLIQPEQAEAILRKEKEEAPQKAYRALGGLGALSIVLGILSLIASNWYKIPPEAKLAADGILSFLLGLTLFFERPRPLWLREIFLAILAGLLLGFFALLGQALQTQAPLWQPLGLWLLLVTPMLLLHGRSFWLIDAWAVLLVAFLALLTQSFRQLSLELIWVAVPFGLYLLSQTVAVRQRLPEWTGAWEKSFWFAVVFFTTIAQSVWRVSIDETNDVGALFFRHSLIPYRAMAASAIGSGLILLLSALKRRNKITFWQGESLEWDLALALSLVFTLSPLLIQHPGLPALSAALFCAYWFLLGVLGLRLGHHRLWSLALYLVSARLFLAYLEIFGSLALQGFGFILSGILLVTLAWGTRRLLHKKPKWATLFLLPKETTR